MFVFESILKTKFVSVIPFNFLNIIFIYLLLLNWRFWLRKDAFNLNGAWKWCLTLFCYCFFKWSPPSIRKCQMNGTLSTFNWNTNNFAVLCIPKYPIDMIVLMIWHNMIGADGGWRRWWRIIHKTNSLKCKTFRKNALNCRMLVQHFIITSNELNRIVPL